MTEILIAAGEPWSVTVNGELVASSDRGPPPEPPEPEPDPDWPVIPRELVDRALGFPLPVYKNSSNASSNYGAIGTGLFATIYAWLGGDRRQEVQENIEAILENLTNPSKCPCGMSGPGAAQEAYALAWFHLYRASDLWAGTDPVKKTRIDAIFLALALIRAWEGNDKSPSEGHWTITGATDTDLKDIGPNISFSIPAQLVLCAEWVGQAELVDWLDEVTVADAREMVEEALGAGSKLYMTLNWANEGIDAEELAKVDYYRAGTSDEAPTDEEIETGLRGLTYYGAPLSDLARFLLPNDERGFNKVLPPTKRSQGSNEFIGANQYAVEGDQGTQVDGKKRGYCINDGPGMPWHGEEGAMVYEINGVDEGGLRSSMGYAFWTVYLVNAMLLPLKLHANPVLADPGVADFLTRWGKARDILGHFDANDYNSVAHIKNKGGTGGPGPVIWSDGREDWEPELNFLIWAAALPS